MLRDAPSFNGFSTNDLRASESFYADVLGLETESTPQGLKLVLADGHHTFVYQKTDHVPATYTILNFWVEDIDKAVASLAESGVKFLEYDNLTDDVGIARGLAHHMGPDIAWFTDPAGNILSVLHD